MKRNIHDKLTIATPLKNGLMSKSMAEKLNNITVGLIYDSAQSLMSNNSSNVLDWTDIRLDINGEQVDIQEFYNTISNSDNVTLYYSPSKDVLIPAYEIRKTASLIAKFLSKNDYMDLQLTFSLSKGLTSYVQQAGVWVKEAYDNWSKE